MERKPQQQTLSIRVSDTLREFLERSKQVISLARGETVSISDVAKTLLESAKDDRLDDRLEAADLSENPTASLVNLRHKWRAGQPWSRAEWIFAAKYIQIACEELTDDPLAPGVEPFVVLLQAFLSVRGLRSERGTGIDRYYLGNLEEGSGWNERTMGPNVVPDAVAKLIEKIRTAGSGKKAIGVGRNLYVALRDEDLVGMAALNGALTPFMPTLFRMAARGHWIREKEPLWLPREGSLALPSVPMLRRDDLWISVQPCDCDISLAIGINSRDVTYILINYPQIRELEAMLRNLVPEDAWRSQHFHAFAETINGTLRYEFRRQGIVVGFTAEQWKQLKSAYFAMLEEPAMQKIKGELSWIYGVI